MTGSDIERELAKIREEFEAFRDSIRKYDVGYVIQGGQGREGRKGGDITLVTGAKGENSEEGGRILFVEADTGRKLQLDFDTKTFKEVIE